MAKGDDIPKTDPSEIEALVQRLKQSNLEPRDVQLVERLLRLVLSMVSLIQHKNASIKRLKRLIFGPSSDKRAVNGSSTEEKAAPGDDAVVAQHFESRAAAISEDIKRAGERIFRQLAFANRGKPINAVTEIDRLAGEEDPELRDELNHRDFNRAGNRSRVW